MRNLILGASGQIGTEIHRILSKNGEDVVATSLSGSSKRKIGALDITEFSSVEKIIAEYKPDIVFNAAAFTMADQAESPDGIRQPLLINAAAGTFLAKCCARRCVKLVHFSSSYVFDGRLDRPYCEKDHPNPISVYGSSKLAGDIGVLNASDRHLLIRTCGVYGQAAIERGNGSFVEAILRKIESGIDFGVITTQKSNLAYAADVAEAVIDLAKGGGGIVNFANSGCATWFDFASWIRKEIGSGAYPFQIGHYNSAAARPCNGELDLSRAAIVAPHQLRPWQDALADYLANRKRA